ncbi:MAG: hypothetical protein ACLFT4_03240 [Bacteroidales bacterium]
MSNFNRFIDRLCNDTAVYWENLGPDGYGGILYGSPEEIDCRWVESKELVLDENGREVVSNANVLVKKDLTEGGFLYHGTLNDLDSDEQEDPKKKHTAYQILRFIKIPSINKKVYKRKAFL